MREALAWLLVALLPFVAGCGGEREEIELTLYCGAGIRPAAEALIEAFEAEHDVAVNPTYAGSGRLLGFRCRPGLSCRDGIVREHRALLDLTDPGHDPPALLGRDPPVRRHEAAPVADDAPDVAIGELARPIRAQVQLRERRDPIRADDGAIPGA